MDERKEYKSPEMDVINIEMEDVITDSNETPIVPGAKKRNGKENTDIFGGLGYVYEKNKKF